MQTQSIRREDRMQASTYREFSRKRYLELKESHSGKMRESEIIQKIIREWDDMKMTKKDRLAGRNEPVATPVKEEQRMVPLELKDKSKLKSTKEKKEEEGQEEARMIQMNEITIRPFDTASPVAKSKPIRKMRPTTTYIMFYKENFEMQSRKHPKWSAAKITKIVKLLWQRAKMQKKAKLKAPKEVAMRKMSGRMMFKRFKLKEGMNKETIKNKWKRLPMESKKMYEAAGNPEAPMMMPRSQAKMTITTTMNAVNRINNDIGQMLLRK